MPFDSELIVRIKEANPIEDVIRGYTNLKSHSSSSKILQGICPFHDDRDPSLTVWINSQSFNCFGCDAGGKDGSDVISFIMLAEKLSFPQAVEFLAKRAGIQIEVNKEFDILYNKQEKRCQKYVKQLFDNDNALRYLLDRGLTEETIRTMRLGYCIGNSNDSWEDRTLLKERIIFPVNDLSGKVISFSGRIYKDKDNRKKYVNESNSSIFIKGRSLYQLSHAKKHIKEEGYAVIVEGYIDALMFYNFGVNNVVSIMSTSLTKEQIELLKKYTNKIILIMDGDSAGEIAAIKHIENIKRNGMQVDVVPLRHGRDPDEQALMLGNKDSIRNWIITSALPAEIYQINNKLSVAWGKIISVQSDALKGILPIIASVESAFTRKAMIAEVSSVLKIGYSVVEEELLRYISGGELGKK